MATENEGRSSKRITLLVVGAVAVIVLLAGGVVALLSLGGPSGSNVDGEPLSSDDRIAVMTAAGDFLDRSGHFGAMVDSSDAHKRDDALSTLIFSSVEPSGDVYRARETAYKSAVSLIAPQSRFYYESGDLESWKDVGRYDYTNFSLDKTEVGKPSKQFTTNISGEDFAAVKVPVTADSNIRQYQVKSPDRKGDDLINFEVDGFEVTEYLTSRKLNFELTMIRSENGWSLYDISGLDTPQVLATYANPEVINLDALTSARVEVGKYKISNSNGEAHEH